MCAGGEPGAFDFGVVEMFAVFHVLLSGAVAPFGLCVVVADKKGDQFAACTFAVLAADWVNI